MMTVCSFTLPPSPRRDLETRPDGRPRAGRTLDFKRAAGSVYTVTQTGHYDSNAEFTDPDTHVTTHGGYVTDSPAPFLGFALSFAGGILITVGSLGLTFGWLSGSDDDDDTYTSTSAAYAQSVPTTRMGWGTDSPPGGS